MTGWLAPRRDASSAAGRCKARAAHDTKVAGRRGRADLLRRAAGAVAALGAALGVGLGSLSALVVGGCEEREAAPPPMPEEVLVRTALVTPRDVDRRRTFPGTTASVRPVELSARVVGFLDAQVTPDGATVKAGEVIYTIDDRPFQDALAEARAGLASAVAQRDLAASDVARNQKLVATGAISPERFDQLEAQLKEAEAQVAAQTAQVSTAELNLSYCTVASPMDGLLGASQVFEGSVVGPGYATKLNTVMQLDPMWAQFRPASTFWPRIEALMEKGPVKAIVTYGGDPDIKAEGELVFADNQVDANTSTILLRVQFPNPKGLFRPGTYVDVDLDMGEDRDVLMIPQDALVVRETQITCWRVLHDWTVESVQIEVGQRYGDDVAVLSGLSPGDRVVVQGVQKLRSGAKVREAAGPAPGEAKPAGSAGSTRSGGSGGSGGSGAPGSNASPERR